MAAIKQCTYIFASAAVVIPESENSNSTALFNQMSATSLASERHMKSDILREIETKSVDFKLTILLTRISKSQIEHQSKSDHENKEEEKDIQISMAKLEINGKNSRTKYHQRCSQSAYQSLIFTSEPRQQGIKQFSGATKTASSSTFISVSAGQIEATNATVAETIAIAIAIVDQSI